MNLHSRPRSLLAAGLLAVLGPLSGSAQELPTLPRPDPAPARAGRPDGEADRDPVGPRTAASGAQVRPGAAEAALPPGLALEGAAAYQRTSLGPGDLVRVVVHRQPEVSGEFTVDESGDLILPLVGRLNVLGKPLPDLRAELERAYRKYFQDPEVAVTPLFRVNVLGEVRQPGLYPVDPTMSLADVLALAGGLAPGGSLAKVDVIHAGHAQRWDLRDPVVLDRAVVGAALSSGDQVVVGERSKGFWGTVPLVTGLIAAGAALVALAAN